MSKVKKDKYDFEVTKKQQDLSEEINEQVHNTDRYNLIFDLMAMNDWPEKFQLFLESELMKEFFENTVETWVPNEGTISKVNLTTEVEWIIECARASIKKIAKEKSYRWLLESKENTEDLTIDVLLRILRAGTYDMTNPEKVKAGYIRTTVKSAIEVLVKEFAEQRAAIVTAHESERIKLEELNSDSGIIKDSLKKVHNQSYQDWLDATEEYRKKEALRSR
jgi:hypothetical protein